MRRKYTLIDKNDFAAISAVQKVSQIASYQEDSHHQTFPEAVSILHKSKSRIATDKGNTRMSTEDPLKNKPHMNSK